MTELTQEQKATNADTLEHIQNVRDLIGMVVTELLKRAANHDRSKLSGLELDTFMEYTPKLKGSTYGSEEYDGFLAAMKPALDHHYNANRHHPEHFPVGVSGMNLVDLLEMLLDWKAATLRHDDGDIWKSIRINAERFGMDEQLVEVLQNTVSYFGLHQWRRG